MKLTVYRVTATNIEVMAERITIPMDKDSNRLIRAIMAATRLPQEEQTAVALQLVAEGDPASAIRACGHEYPDGGVWIDDGRVMYSVLSWPDDFDVRPVSTEHFLSGSPVADAVAAAILDQMAMRIAPDVHEVTP